MRGRIAYIRTFTENMVYQLTFMAYELQHVVSLHAVSRQGCESTLAGC